MWFRAKEFGQVLTWKYRTLGILRFDVMNIEHLGMLVGVSKESRWSSSMGFAGQHSGRHCLPSTCSPTIPVRLFAFLASEIFQERSKSHLGNGYCQQQFFFLRKWTSYCQYIVDMSSICIDMASKGCTIQPGPCPELNPAVPLASHDLMSMPMNGISTMYRRSQVSVRIR